MTAELSAYVSPLTVRAIEQICDDRRERVIAALLAVVMRHKVHERTDRRRGPRRLRFA